MRTYTIEPADDTMATTFEDEIILLGMGEPEPRYFGLRGSAVRMWQLIEERAHNEEAIGNALAAEFNAEPATIQADVATTLDGLESRGLIRKG